MKNINKYFPVLLILLNLSGYMTAYGMKLSLGKIPIAYNYSIYLALSFCVLFYFIHNFKKITKEYTLFSSLYIFMLIYVVAAIIKQFFVPSAIFPYQRMQVCTSFISLGTVFYLMREKTIRTLFKLWWKWIPAIFVVNMLYLSIVNSFSLLHLVFFFLLSYEFLNKSQKIFVLLGVAVLFFAIVQRMDYIRIAGPVLLFVLWQLHFSYSKRICNVVYRLLIVSPIIFLFLALFGVFNIMDMDSYVKGDYYSVTGERMQDDTRTLLYTEAINSSVKNKYVFWGRTPAYGYDTPWFLINGGKNHKWYEESGVFPQRNSEVFSVNIFTWTGLIGLLFWFFFYYIWGIRALKRSKNSYIRVLILYVGIFWVGSWVEYPFDFPSVSYLTLYVVLSFCMQTKYQELTNDEFKIVMRKMLRG